ncbi:hypothetical protein Tco_0019427 [Tanacetum coccineum]
MMTEIYQAFKEPLSHTEGEHVAIEDDTKKPESDKAEEEPTNAVPITTIKPTKTLTPEVQPITTIISTSQPESSQVPQREGKGIATDEQLEDKAKLVKASTVIREDPDEPIRVPYMINGKMCYLTNDEINAHIEKEDKIKKAAEEAKRLEITKTKVKSSRKLRMAKMQVHKRQHTEKAKRMMELNKKRAEQYKWTIYSRLKPEHITDVKIHPNTKPALDELGLIIQKKKNIIVKDLMTSLGKRYERLKKILEELGIQSALPAPVLEQDPSQSSGRKRKHMELKPEIKVPGIECNQSLPEGVPFVNNMVNEESEYEIFFTNVFGDQAFQRWNEIHKVGLDSQVSYLVMASMIKTPENARFCLRLKKMIAKHPDQEKLQSEKVKLELVGYKLD